MAAESITESEDRIQQNPIHVLPSRSNILSLNSTAHARFRSTHIISLEDLPNGFFYSKSHDNAARHDTSVPALLAHYSPQRMYPAYNVYPASLEPLSKFIRSIEIPFVCFRQALLVVRGSCARRTASSPKKVRHN